MTDQTPAPTATENVGRGVTFSLLAIPIGIVAFSVISGLIGVITGIVAIAIPYVSAWLYAKGAGGPLTRKGWGPWIGVTAAAVVLGTLSGIVAGAWYLFTRVGGDGGFFSGAFWTTVRNQFTTGLDDNLFTLLIGFGLGAAGIVAVLRGPRTPKAAVVAPAPAQDATPAPPAPPAPNQPSPGVILNGKPVDPDTKQ